MSDKSVAKIIRQITNARRKAFEKTLPKGKTCETVVEEEVKKMMEEMEKTKPNQKNLEDFAESLCEDNK